MRVSFFATHACMRPSFSGLKYTLTRDRSVRRVAKILKNESNKNGSFAQLSSGTARVGPVRVGPGRIS